LILEPESPNLPRSGRSFCS